jgi:hypothetical protein
VARSPLLALLLTDLPELVDLRRRSSHRPRHHLNTPGHGIAPCGRIRDGLGLDLDDADARIVGTTVMLAVSKITDPRSERGAIVLAYDGAVGQDLRRTGDGSPLASAVEEGDVDGRVIGKVVSLAGLGVGMEKEVDATGFLSSPPKESDQYRYEKITLFFSSSDWNWSEQSKET